MVGDIVALFVGGVGGGKTPLSIEGGEVVIIGVGAPDVDGVGLFSISPPPPVPFPREKTVPTTAATIETTMIITTKMIIFRSFLRRFCLGILGSGFNIELFFSPSLV